MSPRLFSLAALPLALVLFTAACSDAVGPNASAPSLRQGADDPPGDNRGIDLPGDDRGTDIRPSLRQGADDPAGDVRGGHGADDPANHG